MKGKIIPMLMLMLGINTTTLLAQDECCNFGNFDKVCCDSGSFWQNLKASSQIGAAYEQHTNFGEVFLYWNQTINDHWFYEIRAVGIRNWIVNTPPETTITVKDERVVWGGGSIWIFGYVFDLCPKISVMPFYRGQVLTNSTSTIYKDRFGNELTNIAWTQFGGLKVTLKVTDDFTPYAQWFGGYRRIKVHGKGFWNPPSHVHLNALVSTFEFGAPFYFKCPCLCDAKFLAVPYIQFNLTDPSPTREAINAPYKFGSVVTSEFVWAIRFGYAF